MVNISKNSLKTRKNTVYSTDSKRSKKIVGKFTDNKATPKYEFPTDKDIKYISKFVSKRKDKDVQELEKQSLKWIRTAWANKMDYEVSWFGIPIIQNPYDMIVMQELIFKLKPDVIIETGIAHGGSLIFYSSLLSLLGKGTVIGIDIDIRKHNLKLLSKHPFIKRVNMFEGSSTDQTLINKVKKLIKPKSKVLVILDSDHRKPHVLNELNIFKNIVTTNSYMVVFDTFMPFLSDVKGATNDFQKNSAMDAVREFLKENKNFEVDKSMEKFYVTSCPGGFLKRKS